MMATVFYPVSRKDETRIAKCDLDDWLNFKASKKTVQTCSSGKKPWYISYRLNGKRTQFHRVITDCADGMFVDHINNDSLDNRKKNLRIVTLKQNNQNVQPRTGCVSKYRGISFNKLNNNWRAKITCNGRRYEIGSFATQKEAALAYNKKALELFGEYAYQNKVV